MVGATIGWLAMVMTDAAAGIDVLSLLGKKFEETNVITCHLGNGASLTAIKSGKSIDTTLGFGTTGGVPMGTR